ncbi:MAG: peptidoglycan recognition protein family protein, partial [Lachnospiraceae bacterium]|nr:peptidoglycan recognition protein family protein [Lachnospiraceae bacterium]
MWIVAMSAVIFFMGKAFYKGMQKSPVVEKDITVKPIWEEVPVMAAVEKKPDIREDFLTISEYNRPGTKLATVKNIFVHYTANKGTSAAQNRSYFENLGITHERAASAHFIIGFEGEIVQCIPLEEEAYAVVERNGDSISIECCYISEDGSFTKET